jgi:hypothetical protein
MSFTPYTPTRGLSVKTLRPGECSVSKSGILALNIEDLKRVRVTDRAVIMTDPQTVRIALRAPIVDEMDALAVSVARAKKGTTCRISAVGGALRSLGIDTEQAAGRYTAEYCDKNGLLVINLADAAKKQKAKKK